MLNVNSTICCIQILGPKGAPQAKNPRPPSFPLLKQLGGAIEVRSNWKIYVDEFAAAAQLLGLDTQVKSLSATDPMTLFERKYAANSENLWVCTAATA